MTIMDHPTRTCASCAFIGSLYWNNETHHCGKSDLRRKDNFRSCGDFAEDFMSEFRKFYDATAAQRACRYYEEREPCDRETLDLLHEVSRAGKEGYVAKFFSRENSLLSPLREMFVVSDFAYPREPARGERRYRLTKVGQAEVSRDSDARPKDGDEGNTSAPLASSAGPKGIAQPLPGSSS